MLKTLGRPFIVDENRFPPLLDCDNPQLILDSITQCNFINQPSLPVIPCYTHILYIYTHHSLIVEISSISYISSYHFINPQGVFEAQSYAERRRSCCTNDRNGQPQDAQRFSCSLQQCRDGSIGYSSNIWVKHKKSPTWIVPFGDDFPITWGRGWMTKASGVGERRKGRGELRRDCQHRVAALFVPTRMQQWYIDIWYITMIYMGEGAGGGGGGLSREKSRDVPGEPRNTC